MGVYSSATVPGTSPASRSRSRAKDIPRGEQMWEKPDPETACVDAIRHWSSLPRLAEFAANRHGYHDSNGGFGLEYPDSLDEYDREVLGRFIPPGFVLIQGFWD